MALVKNNFLCSYVILSDTHKEDANTRILSSVSSPYALGQRAKKKKKVRKAQSNGLKAWVCVRKYIVFEDWVCGN